MHIHSLAEGNKSFGFRKEKVESREIFLRRSKGKKKEEKNLAPAASRSQDRKSWEITDGCTTQCQQGGQLEWAH